MFLAPLTAALTTAKHCEWGHNHVEGLAPWQTAMKMEEQTHVLHPKEHPKPAKDPKRQETGRKGAEARKRNKKASIR